MDFGDRDVARVDAGSFISAARRATGGVAVGTAAREYRTPCRRRRDLASSPLIPTLRANSSLIRITHAAPSTIPPHIARVSGGTTTRSASTLLDCQQCRSAARSLRLACRRFLAAMRRNARAVGAICCHVALGPAGIDVHEYRAAFAERSMIGRGRERGEGARAIRHASAFPRPAPARTRIAR